MVTLRRDLLQPLSFTEQQKHNPGGAMKLFKWLMVVAVLVAVVAPARPASALPGLLQRVAPGAATYAANAAVFSVPGDVTAPATFVDVQIPAVVGSLPTSGCEAADFAGFPRETSLSFSGGSACSPSRSTMPRRPEPWQW